MLLICNQNFLLIGIETYKLILLELNTKFTEKKIIFKENLKINLLKILSKKIRFKKIAF